MDEMDDICRTQRVKEKGKEEGENLRYQMTQGLVEFAADAIMLGMAATVP